MNAVDTALSGKSAVKLVSGNHACALGAVAAGCGHRFDATHRGADHCGNRSDLILHLDEHAADLG